MRTRESRRRGTGDRIPFGLGCGILHLWCVGAVLPLPWESGDSQWPGLWGHNQAPQGLGTGYLLGLPWTGKVVHLLPNGDISVSLLATWYAQRWRRGSPLRAAGDRSALPLRIAVWRKGHGLAARPLSRGGALREGVNWPLCLGLRHDAGKRTRRGRRLRPAGGRGRRLRSVQCRQTAIGEEGRRIAGPARGKAR